MCELGKIYQRQWSLGLVLFVGLFKYYGLVSYLWFLGKMSQMVEVL